MRIGSRWVWEVTSFCPEKQLARLECNGQIRDVNTEDGKPLDPAWREIVPLPPPPDDDTDDCDDDAFSRPARRVETIYLEDLRAEIEAPEPTFTEEQFPIVMVIEPETVSAPRGCATRHHETRVPACVFCRGLSI